VDAVLLAAGERCALLLLVGAAETERGAIGPVVELRPPTLMSSSPPEISSNTVFPGSRVRDWSA